jgi:hypothetical protein
MCFAGEGGAKDFLKKRRGVEVVDLKGVFLKGLGV